MLRIRDLGSFVLEVGEGLLDTTGSGRGGAGVTCRDDGGPGHLDGQVILAPVA
jgi:hypothetical protein